MKIRFLPLLLALLLICGLFSGCGRAASNTVENVEDILTAIEDARSDSEEVASLVQDALSDVKEAVEEAQSSLPVPDEDELGSVSGDIQSAIEGASESLQAALEETMPSAEELQEAQSVNEDGEYTAPNDVALYLHLFGHLPSNFITKSEARALGWDNSQGNLWDVAPGKSIGGDYFGNYEGLLPDGSYHECDVNYSGGYRGAERIIYGDDGSIYYTNDHYNSFEQLY